MRESETAGAGATMRQIGQVERQVRRADRFQQRHAVIAFPWAVMQKFGNDQAGSKATLMAYYGLFALFPLLLLLATVLGFALSGNAALREQLIDSALGNFPVIGDQLRSEVHPLEGSATALIIGIAGTLYGSFGIGFASQNAMNTIWNIPFVHWPSWWQRYLRTFGVIGLLGLAVLFPPRWPPSPQRSLTAPAPRFSPLALQPSSTSGSSCSPSWCSLPSHCGSAT